MKPEHEREREREEILLAALARERARAESGASAGELASELEPLERDLARDWLATARALEELGRAEHEAQDEPSPEDLALARAFLRERTIRARTPPWGLLLLAALVVLAGVVLVLRSVSQRSPEPEPFLLGTAPLALFEPLGAVDSFALFRWQADALPSNGTYRLVVEGGGRELLRIEGLGTAQYTPEPDARARLEAARAITWSVTALSGDGADSILAWGSSQASLRSR